MTEHSTSKQRRSTSKRQRAQTSKEIVPASTTESPSIPLPPPSPPPPLNPSLVEPSLLETSLYEPSSKNLPRVRPVTQAVGGVSAVERDPASTVKRLRRKGIPVPSWMFPVGGGIVGIGIAVAVLWFGFGRDPLGIFSASGHEISSADRDRPSPTPSQASTRATRPAAPAATAPIVAQVVSTPRKPDSRIADKTNPPKLRSSGDVVGKKNLKLPESGSNQSSVSKTEERPAPVIPIRQDQASASRYEISREVVTWTEARAACERRGGHLARIESPEELLRMIEVLSAERPANYLVWIDGSDAAEEGVWRYSNGAKLSFDWWEPKQPDDYRGRQDFAVITPVPNGRVDDSDGHVYLRYVCEWDDIPKRLPSSGAPSQAAPIFHRQGEFPGLPADAAQATNSPSADSPASFSRP